MKSTLEMQITIIRYVDKKSVAVDVKGKGIPNKTKFSSMESKFKSNLEFGKPIAIPSQNLNIAAINLVQ